MKIYNSIPHAIEDASYRLQHMSHRVHPDQWQSMDVSKKPEMSTYEILNYSFSAFMASEDLAYYREAIKPNLPWADRHFDLERASGEPINPGLTWKEWPYALSADKFRKGEKFSHSYAERYWPKYAGVKQIGQDPSVRSGEWAYQPRQGIRYAYGDLNDVIKHLVEHPLSRQAYLPVWFPEDTGVVHGERVPCSLGYHFIQRNGHLHVGYWLRSCDFVRHFRDDIYLSIRLGLWVLDRLRNEDLAWLDVKPGMFTMWMTSLHMFENDMRTMFPDRKERP